MFRRRVPAELGGAIKAVRRAIRAGAGFNHGQSPLERLSKREFDVCRGLTRDDSLRAIAARLNISPKTGYVYRGSIFGKLKVPSLAGLTRPARHYGIVSCRTRPRRDPAFDGNFHSPRIQGQSQAGHPGTRRQGLHSEILLIPQEKLQAVAVKAILAGETVNTPTAETSRAEREKGLSYDPWRDMPGDGE